VKQKLQDAEIPLGESNLGASVCFGNLEGKLKLWAAGVFEKMLRILGISSRRRKEGGQHFEKPEACMSFLASLLAFCTLCIFCSHHIGFARWTHHCAGTPCNTSQRLPKSPRLRYVSYTTSGKNLWDARVVTGLGHKSSHSLGP